MCVQVSSDPNLVEQGRPLGLEHDSRHCAQHWKSESQGKGSRC